MKNNNDANVNNDPNNTINYMSSNEVQNIMTDILIDIRDLRERVRNMESIVFNNYNSNKAE
tara:strand:+ start:364 stop:546 length:183 start_codon:yes stop_codon:yes gene_type:complete